MDYLLRVQQCKVDDPSLPLREGATGGFHHLMSPSGWLLPASLILGFALLLGPIAAEEGLSQERRFTPREALMVERVRRALERNPGEDSLVDRLLALYKENPTPLLAVYREEAEAGKPGAALVLGKLFLRLGDVEEAAASFKLATHQDPEDWRGWVALASACQLSNDVKGEHLSLKRAIEVLPTEHRSHPELVLRLARSLLNAGEKAEAQEILSRIPPHRWGASVGEAAQIASEIGAIEQAISLLRVAAEQSSPQQLLDSTRRLLEMWVSTDQMEAFVAEATEAIDRVAAGSWAFMELGNDIHAMATRKGTAWVERLEETWTKSEDTDPVSPRILWRRALLAAANGDPEEEARVLTQLMRLRPQDQAIAQRLIHLHELLGDPETALSLLDRFIAQRPSETEWVIAAARLLLMAQREQEAIERLHKLMEAKPKDRELSRRVVAFLKENRFWLEARRILEREAAKPDAEASDVEALVEILFDQRDFDAAVQTLDAWAERATDDAERARRLLSSAERLAEASQHEVAAAQIQRALPFVEDESETRMRLAAMFEAQGLLERARLELLAAGRSATTSAQRLTADRQLFSLLNRTPAPSKEGETFTRLEVPGFGSLPIRRLHEGGQGPTSEVVETSVRLSAEARSEGSAEGWLRVAEWMAMMRNHEKALQAVDQAIEAEPKGLLAPERGAALAAEVGLHDRAIAYLRLAIENGGETFTLQRRIARLLAESGRFDAAVSLLNAQLEAGAPEMETLTELSAIHQRSGYNSDALAALQRIVAIAPSTHRTEALLNLARAYERLGEPREGIEALLSEAAKIVDIQQRDRLLNEIVDLTDRHKLTKWTSARLRDMQHATPSDLFYAQTLARLAEKAGRADDALKHLSSRGRSTTIRSPAEWGRLISLASETGDIPQAIRLARLSAAQPSEDPAASSLRVAKLLQETLQLSEAEVEYERLVIRFGRNPGVQQAAAEFFRLMDKPEARLAALRRVTALEPKNAAQWVEFGESLLEAGQTKEAVAAWDHVLELIDPDVEAETFLSPVPRPSTLVGSLQILAVAGEEGLTQAQADVLRGLRETAARPAVNVRTPLGLRLQVIRSLASLAQENSEASMAAGEVLRSRATKVEDWRGAMYAAWFGGRQTEALDLLADQMQASTAGGELAQNFLWLCVVDGDAKRLADWIATEKDPGVQRMLLKIAFASHLGFTGSGEIDFVRRLLPDPSAKSSLVWQLARIAGRSNAPLLASWLIEQLWGAGEPARAQITESVEAATWLCVAGNQTLAVEVLNRAVAEGGSSRIVEAAQALRLRYLLTAEPERDGMRSFVMEEAAHAARPLLLFVLDALREGESTEPIKTLAHRGSLDREMPEGAPLTDQFEVALLLRSWNRTEHAKALLRSTLRSSLLETIGGRDLYGVEERCRLALVGWELEAVPPRNRSGLLETMLRSGSNEMFLQNLGSHLENEGSASAAADVFAALAERWGRREIFSRAYLMALRKAGRFEEAFAWLMRTLEEPERPELQAVLLEQTAELAVELDDAQVPHLTNQLLEKAGQWQPDEPLLRQAWAAHRARLGFHEEALEIFAELSQRFPEKNEFVALAAQAALDAEEPGRGLALLGSRTDPPLAEAVAKEVSRLRIANHDLDRVRLLKRPLMNSDYGSDLLPLIVAFGKAGRLTEAAGLTHWAKRAMAEPMVAFQLETALLRATLAAQGSDEQVAWQIRRLADAAEAFDSPGELNHFLNLLEIAADYPGSEAVRDEIMRLAETRPSTLPLERALALWIGHGWQKESSRLVELMATEPRIPESTLLFAVAGLIENKRSQEAIDLADTLNRRYPFSASNRLLLALAAAGSDEAKMAQAVQEAEALAVFDPDAMARVGLFWAEQHEWQRAHEAFERWSRLTLPRNASFRTVSAVAAVHISPTRSESADRVRRFYEEALTLPDVLPLVTFHTAHAAGTDLKRVCQEIGISPFWATQAALVSIQRRVQSGDLRGALQILGSNPQVMLAPNAPIREMERLVDSRLGGALVPLLMEQSQNGAAPRRLINLLKKAKASTP